MIAGLFAVTLPGFAAGAVLMGLAARKVASGLARARWIKFAVFFVIVHIALGAAAGGRAWIAAFMIPVVAAGSIELALAWRRMPRPRPGLVWPGYALAAGAAVAAAWALPPARFALLFLVTAAFDGFSQVVGQLVGRHRLAPRVSPGKTVEGVAGGLAAAATVALAVRPLLGPTGAAASVALAIAAGLTGLAGDLAASWAKRRAGIKDFSSALPGQGGFLDRFDSLLGALAMVGLPLTLAGGA
jgi:phosphatidate cytidylyltransferase